MANANSVIKVSSQWRHLKGLSYGMQQASLWGIVVVNALPEKHIEKLDDSMHALIGAGSVLTLALPSNAKPQLKLLHRLVHWTGAIQRHFKIPVSEKYHVQQRHDPETDNLLFEVALPTANRHATILAFQWVSRIIFQLVTDKTQFGTLDAQLHELDTVQASLKKFSEPGLNSFSILHAAHQLDIPVSNLSAQTYQLGTGCRTRWMNSTITDRTPAISVNLARNKMTTASVLRSAGLPGATHLLVRSADAAIKAAHQLGFPVVVKPADLEQGVGVAADLIDDSSVATAYAQAKPFSEQILVEKWFDGFTHRLTVIEGQVIRVSKRIAGGVIGDGKQSIASLVAALQQQGESQHRVRRLDKPLLSLDDEALGLLAQNGRNSSNIPAAGEYIRLRRRDNVNAGGTSEHCPLDTIHPDNLQLALDATSLLRLDFAGIDLIIKDIGKSWLSIGALICEVNAKPQVVAPEQPMLYRDILKRMFPEGARVPAHLVICPDDQAPPEALIQQWTRKQGCNGLSNANGLWINGVRASLPFNNSLTAARALLGRPDITGAVCMMTLQDIARLGLPLNRWDSTGMINASQQQGHDKKLLTLVRNMLLADKANTATISTQ